MPWTLFFQYSKLTVPCGFMFHVVFRETDLICASLWVVILKTLQLLARPFRGPHYRGYIYWQGCFLLCVECALDGFHSSSSGVSQMFVLCIAWSVWSRSLVSQNLAYSCAYISEFDPKPLHKNSPRKLTCLFLYSRCTSKKLRPARSKK